MLKDTISQFWGGLTGFSDGGHYPSGRTEHFPLHHAGLGTQDAGQGRFVIMVIVLFLVCFI